MQQITFTLFGKGCTAGFRNGLMTLLRIQHGIDIQGYKEQAAQLMISTGVSAGNPIKAVLENPLYKRLEQFSNRVNILADGLSELQCFIDNNCLYFCIVDPKTKSILDKCWVDLLQLNEQVIFAFFNQYVTLDPMAEAIIYSLRDEKVSTYIENFNSIDHLTMEDIIILQQDFDLGLYKLYLENCSGCTYKEY